jgi:hypothetical protein
VHLTLLRWIASGLCLSWRVGPSLEPTRRGRVRERRTDREGGTAAGEVGEVGAGY